MTLRSDDLPGDLLDAHMNGRMVLFVGAGASIDAPSCLPTFEGLAERVAAEACKEPPGREPLDEFLGRLVEQGVNVRGEVRRLIGDAGSSPNSLHRAIAAVALSSPAPRIITTNYDRHLSTCLGEEADRRSLPPVAEFASLAYPQREAFEGIVYLHGSVDESAENLVVTDGDFGQAYLAAPWSAAQFLARVFSHSAVLFIGYSLRDTMMRYLARGLPTGEQLPGRFAVCGDTDEEREWWEGFGITPVTCPDYSLLPGLLQEWADRPKKGMLHHQRRVEAICATEPPLSAEDEDYLTGLTDSDDLRRLFFEQAKGASWLSWASGRPWLAGIFAAGGDGDYSAASWFARTIAADPESADAAMALFRSHGCWFSVNLWLEIAWVVEQGLEADGDRARQAKRWIPHLAAHVPDRPLGWSMPGHHLAGMLEHLDPASEAAEVLLVAGRLLEPVPPRPASMLLGLPTLRFADWSWWLRPWWEQQMLPGLADRHLAEQVISLLDGCLRTAHQIAAAGLDEPEEGAHALSLDRETILPSDLDGLSSEGVGLLVDMARDSLVALLRHHPDLGEAWLEVWAGSSAPLFRRLAVHGWVERQDAGPDQKVEWLARSGAAADRWVRREARRLAEAALPYAGPDAVEALIAAFTQPPPDPGGELEGGVDVQEAGDWLELVAQCAQGSTLAQEAFASFRADHPSWQPYDLPGFVDHTESHGWPPSVRDGGDQIPLFDVDELIGMIADDPRQVVEWAAGLPEPSESFARPAPQREAAARIVEAARGRPDAAIALLDQLAVRAAAGGGVPMEEQLAESLLRLIAETPADEFPFDAVLDLLRRLWQAGCGNWTGEHDSRSGRYDWASDALNHWAGIAARAAFYAAGCERASREPPAPGLSERAKELLELMIGGDRYPNHLAQTELARLVRFLHEADRDWAVAHILPMFDPGDAERARRCWNSYLRAGRFDQDLLDDGMLDCYSSMCSRTGVLAEGDRHRLARHWAQLVVLMDLDPEERRVSRLIADSDLEMRLDWIEQVALQLSGLMPQDADAQWDRWMRAHWENRLRGAQKTLADDEATAIANWLPHLGARFPEAVRLACERHMPIGDANQLMVAHLSGEGASAGLAGAGRHMQTCPEQVGVLIAHMMRSTGQLPGFAESSISRRLGKLVAQLLADVEGDLADEIAEQAKRLDVRYSD